MVKTGMITKCPLLFSQLWEILGETEKHFFIYHPPMIPDECNYAIYYNLTFPSKTYSNPGNVHLIICLQN